MNGSGGGEVVQWEDPRPWPKLESPALHGIAGEIIDLILPHTEAHPVALLLELLVGFGNAVGAGPHVRVGGVRHPARLFAAITGRTARGRKGQAHADMGLFLSAADPGWWRDAAVSGLASGEGLIAKLAGRDGAPPKDHRAFVYEPEFSRVLAVAERKGETLNAILRAAWDDGRLEVTTRKDPLLADGCHVSIITHITVEELKAKLCSLDACNGFGNRFLFACVERSKKLPNGGNLPDAEVARFGQRLRDLLMLARRRGEMHRTADAEPVWSAIYENVPDEEGLVGALTARCEAQMLRLSLVYALLDEATAIDVPHVLAGYALANYSTASARFIFGDVLGDPVADRLLGELREIWPEGIDGEGQAKLFSRHMEYSRLEAARQSIERRGFAVRRKILTGGRSRDVLFAVPKRASLAASA